MSKYRRKPLVIEAFQWTSRDVPPWMDEAINEGYATIYSCSSTYALLHPELNLEPYMEITTATGSAIACIGDYIIHGLDGDIYPCKPDVFEKLYEEVEEE